MLRGIEPAALMHQFRGTAHAGLFDIRKHRFAPYTIPIATQLPHAVGFAHGARLDGQGIVVLACFGDGATSEGDFHEACNFAGVWKAPVVFFCQNNQYAISVPVHQQTAAPTLHVRALGYGMPGWRVDGNDVLASYVVGREAVAHARAGKGPAFIEALTYRLGGHSTADDASRYRSDAEVARWQGLDPIARLETYLRAAGILTDDLASQVEAKSRQLQAEVRAAIFDAATPDPAIMFDHVYSGRGPGLEKQRADCIAEGEQG
jgi:pyruvate dehydrogenase E1 component alpha subunit